jgi:hypothetical protein
MSHNKEKNKDPSQKYYNILVKNNNTGFDKDGNPTPSSDSVVLAFEETRTIPYIHHPRDFYMSVVSFDMDTQAIPVFIADPIVGSDASSNQLVYTITMYYHEDATLIAPAINTVVQQQVIWFPDDNSATVPTGVVTDKYNMVPYYYAYTYQHFINVVNASLQSCFNSLGISPPTSTSIFLTLENNYVTMNADLIFWTDVDGTPVNQTRYVKIYFNTELANLFSGFSYIIQAQPLQLLNGTNITPYLNTNKQLLFTAYNSFNKVAQVPTDFTTVPPSGLTYVVLNKSEYSPLAYWNPIDRVLFTTAFLPVVPTLVSLTSNVVNSKNDYNANTQYIICDFAAQTNNGTEYKPNITYLPPAEYVLNELYGDTPLYNIAINVFWKDLFGDLHPFTLEAGGTAAIKIMFRKKDFYFDE